MQNRFLDEDIERKKVTNKNVGKSSLDGYDMRFSSNLKEINMNKCISSHTHTHTHTQSHSRIRSHSSQSRTSFVNRRDL